METLKRKTLEMPSWWSMTALAFPSDQYGAVIADSLLRNTEVVHEEMAELL
jgi:hypothetical protein